GQPVALGAVVVLDPAESAGDAEAPDAALRARLRKLLAPHMVPGRILALADLPLSANGKTDRAAVAAALDQAAGGPSAAPPAPPRSDLERMIMMVWGELLGGARFGVHDEFFALGGDSVQATALVARLRDELDTGDVSVRMLFAAPTVAGLAQRMRAVESNPGRLDRVASIAWEIAGLADDEVDARLEELPGAGDEPSAAGAGR
ncbi:phosphopantetheine-binding protein, partial [Frankia sp. AgKG'84/4]|uniref:phosphopantetheine-binding protein n=1 Tax=Frankia sp. AgKG'84/4 TaxID=573490 RepID=UPI00202AB916